MGGLAWGFEISRKKDVFGREVYVSADEYTSLLIAKPEEFEFECRPVEGRERDMEGMWRAVNGGEVGDVMDRIVCGKEEGLGEKVSGDVLIDV